MIYQRLSTGKLPKIVQKGYRTNNKAHCSRIELLDSDLEVKQKSYVARATYQLSFAEVPSDANVVSKP